MAEYASRVVYCTQTLVLAHAGQRIAVRAGEPWDAGDPLVAHYPDMFAADASVVRSTIAPGGLIEVKSAPEAAPVEAATRAPGEKRNTRRRA